MRIKNWKEYLIENIYNNVGYRSGDLNKKAEQRNNMAHTIRSTGHFGTGYYFFGTKEMADKYDNRPTTIINLDKYNLAKGTLELHELLKCINNDYYNKDYKHLENYIRMVYKYFNALEEEPEYWYPRNQKEMDETPKEKLKEIDKQIDINLKASTNNNNKIKQVIANIFENKIDSPSTIVMKSLGFDGVDVRNTELDNPKYGSVIYDI